MKTAVGFSEKEFSSFNGYAMVSLAVVLKVILAYSVWQLAIQTNPEVGFWRIAIMFLLAAAAVFIWVGLYMLQPNEGALITLFGGYRGTDRSAGLRW